MEEITSTSRPREPSGRLGWFYQVTYNHFYEFFPCEPADWSKTSYGTRRRLLNIFNLLREIYRIFEKFVWRNRSVRVNLLVRQTRNGPIAKSELHNCLLYINTQLGEVKNNAAWRCSPTGAILIFLFF